MTMRIERDSDRHGTVIRLIGRIQSEHLQELKAQMGSDVPRIAFDMAGVTLVDVDVVRFLGTCEAEGIEVIHCSPYIREWILRERERSA